MVRDGAPGGGRLRPLHIAAVYLVFGFLALFVSDVLLVRVLEDPLLGLVQGLKGGLEVVVTAGLIFLLVRWSWRDLRLRERAIHAAPVGITISDPGREDNPLIFANERFQELTGYDEDEILGRNCRFLQGEETDPGTRAELREAIDAGRPVSVDIRNYRKNGERFWNKVDIAPVRNADGTITNFVGFQTDITDRKVREQRLRVLNRVLRHNFRNKLTVIGGHAEMLEERLDGSSESLEAIQRAVADLQDLSETVRANDASLEAAADTEATVDLGEQLRVLGDALDERNPGTTIEVEIDAASAVVRAAGIVQAVEKAVENALRDRDGSARTVRVRVTREADGWVTIDVEDDGPGTPPVEVEVLAEGEQALRHADRLELWTIHWIVSLAGGTMSVEESALGGTHVSISVPGAGG